MRDQASTLRNLIQRHSAAEPALSCVRARMVAFTSGKGGVGKSNLALNVAVAAALMGTRVCLLDANPGSSSVDLLCGLNCYWNFRHVLTGAKSLHDVILKGPAGINILPGAHALLELTSPSTSIRHELAEQIAGLESGYDLLIVDAGTGPNETTRRFVHAADVTFLVMTPEATAISDAYALLKTWQEHKTSTPELLVNRSVSAADSKQILDRFGQTVELFLRCSRPNGSSVAEDAAVPRAVAARQPFILATPDGAAAHDVRMITKQLLAAPKPTQKEALLNRL